MHGPWLSSWSLGKIGSDFDRSHQDLDNAIKYPNKYYFIKLKSHRSAL